MNTAEHNAHGSNAIQNSNELDEASRKSVGPPISTKKEVSEDALKKAVLEKTGLECTSLHKIAEGGFNQIFVAELASGPDLIARVAIGSSEPLKAPSDSARSERTRSEVATLNFIRQNCPSIPVPEVLGFNECYNDVGAPYILQSRIIGRKLPGNWFNIMTKDEQDDLTRQIASFELEMWKPHFSDIGCLYQLSSEPYYVGRAVDSSICADLLEDRGPWKSTRAYVTAHLQAGIDALAVKTRSLSREEQNILSFYQQLRFTLERLTHLDISDETCRPVLFHDDYQSGNMLVDHDDPKRIVGIVDWEAASLVPLWYAVTANKMYSYWPNGPFLYKKREDIPDYYRQYYEAAGFKEDGSADPLPALKEKYQSVLSTLPGYKAALLEREPLRILFGLACSRHSSMAGLKEDYLEFRAAWPKEDLDVLKDLDSFLEGISGNGDI